MSYSLALERDAGPFTKFMHYAVAPGLLAVNAYSDVKQLNAANSVTPQKLIASGFTPQEAAVTAAKIKRVAKARAIGDAVAWAAYPLSFRNKALHYGTAVASVFAPNVFAAAAKKF